MEPFRFKRFSLSHGRSTLKIGTDALLLASLTEVATPTCRAASEPVGKTLLDVGCGCGVVAFCLAQKFAQSGTTPLVYGIDPDEDSVAEATANADMFPLLPRQCFHFVRGKVQDLAADPTAPRFDLIVSNPPFFQADLKPLREADLRSKHAAGQLTLDELLQSVLKLLKDDGRFALILPPFEYSRFDRLAQGFLFCRSRVHVQPVANKPVHRVVAEYARQNGPCTERQLVIRSTPDAYTAEYSALMEPFLLG